MRYELWPENAGSFTLYGALHSQWVKDASGVGSGLNYSAVLDHLNFTEPDAERRKALYDDLRVMERAAIPVHYEMAKKAMDDAQRKAQMSAATRPSN